jgi:hypothetical protein
MTYISKTDQNSMVTASNTSLTTTGDDLTVQDPDQDNVFAVNIKIVEKVSEYDFPATRRAWEALEKAGISAGGPISRALHHGLGYPMRNVSSNQYYQFDRVEGLEGETRYSQDSIVGYEYKSSQDAQKLLESSNQSYAVALRGSFDLITAPEKHKIDTVEIVAVSKDNMPLLGQGLVLNNPSHED